VKVVEARVHGLVVEHPSGQHIVLLREVEGTRVLPIWIGPGEAMAIRRLLAEESFPRPLTHDLIALVVEGLHARVTRVLISELRESTFFASLLIERDKEVLSVDARPSDAIAVALRARAPILVNEVLMHEPPEQEEEAPTAPPTSPEPPREPNEEEQAERLRRMLEKLDPEDFGKFSM
jgi:hypothetical protein